MDPLQVSFLISFVVFLLAVYSCSLSIHLLLNRFNVVVANGHGDIEMGWRFAGLQIPSMAYPPSSTVSYFNQICIISNPNDWLIVDGVFFVIRCIILLGNKTILQDGRRSPVWRLRILSFSVWDADC